MAASNFFVAVLLLCATSLCFGYTIINVQPSSLSTTDSTSIVVTGTGFDASITKVTISGIECGDINVVSDTSLTCTALPGVGQGNVIAIGSATAAIVNFDLATTTTCGAVQAPVAVTHAQTFYVTVCGHNFGLDTYTSSDSDWTGTLTGFVGTYAATLYYHDDSSLIFALPPTSVATGTDLVLTINFGIQALVVPDLYISYPTVQNTTVAVTTVKIAVAGTVAQVQAAIPDIKNGIAKSLNKSASDIDVTAQGNKRAAAGVTLVVTIKTIIAAGTPTSTAAPTTTVPPTTIGATLLTSLTNALSDPASPISQAFAATGAVITGVTQTTSVVVSVSITVDHITPAYLSTTTTTPVIIVGSGFTAGIQVTIAGVACTGVTIIDPNTLSCTAQPGSGFGNAVLVSNAAGAVFEAGVANVASFGPITATTCGVSAGTNTIVTVCGSGFGTAENTFGNPLWSGLIVPYIYGAEGEIISLTNTQLVFKAPLTVNGADLSVSVQFGNTTIEAVDTFSYPLPVVSDARRKTTSTRGNGETVIVSGNFFGLPSPLIHITVTIGDYNCGSVKHISNNEIQCVVNGQGSNVQVVVSVNGRSSISIATSQTASSIRYDFINPASAGLSCLPPNGAADVFSTDICNCWSGFASSTPLGLDCAQEVKCAGRQVSQTVGQNPIVRPVTEFKDDKLHIFQKQPVVKGRRDTVIQFVVPALASKSPNTPAGTVGSQTCFYPGALWEKKVNQLDCVDEFYGVLPWTEHELCGFVEDTSSVWAAQNPPVRVYTTSVVATYTEVYKGKNNLQMFRKVSNSYMVSVKFTRQIVALTKTAVDVIIADQNAITSLQVHVIGDALYDVATRNTIINLDTVIVWPYQLADVTLNATWTKSSDNTETGTVTATAILDVVLGEYECDSTQDSNCRQLWVLTIKNDDVANPVCNLKGTLTFNTGLLLCRDFPSVQSCPFNPNTNFSIKIGATDLCDSASQNVDASAGLTHVLEPFFDSSLATAQNVFQTGDMIYFKLTVNDPVSTIDSITFNNIVVFNADSTAITPPSDTLYSVASVGAVPVPSAFLSGSEANITQEIRQPHELISPKTDAVLSFNFRLTRAHLTSIATLSSATPADQTNTLTVSATIDIWYHGNQKRTIVANSALPATTHSQITFYDLGADQQTEQTNKEATVEDGFESNMFSSASTTTAVFAFVVAALMLLA